MAIAPSRLEMNGSGVEMVEAPVVIIGAGPVGMLGAYMFAKLKIKVILVERFPGRQPVPKAHALNPRSLEICRQFDISTARIRTLGAKREDAMFVRFRTQLAGELLGTLPYERMDPEVLDLTPEMIHNISQPEFQDLLDDYLKKESEYVDVRRQFSFVSSTESNGKVTIKLKNEKTGEFHYIQSTYLIGTDGAGSTVRDSLGINMSGEPNMHKIMTIHLRTNLRPVVGDDGVGMLHWILDPKGRGNFLGYCLDNNVVMMHHFDSSTTPESSFTPEVLRKIVDEALGTELEYEIVNRATWAHTRRVADVYRAGNAFIAGDAAHMFPPTGGLGLNSGVADIHNLVWKLAAVIQGWAGDALLATYSSERQPIAVINSKQSVKNGQKIFVLLREFLPAEGEDLDAARITMHENLKDPEFRARIKDAIEFQREHFDNLNLHLGYQYVDGWRPLSCNDYIPSFAAGSRLPHTWIDFQGGASFDNGIPVAAATDLSYCNRTEDSGRNSTLDLIHPSKLSLVAGPSGAQLALKLKKDLESAGVSTRLAIEGQDFSNASNAWLEESGLAKGGALLVRPDQHVLRQIDWDDDATIETIVKEVVLAVGL